MPPLHEMPDDPDRSRPESPGGGPVPPLPEGVAAAYRRAEEVGFEHSSEPEVGRVLAALAASVPLGGRILELGTGVGVGLAWLVHGLGPRTDVEVVTVELDPDIQAVARSAPWPGYVRFELGDGAQLVGTLGTFDVIFADAPGGKLVGLQGTIATLRRGGVLVMDDMRVPADGDPDAAARISRVRHQLVSHPELICAELDYGTGIILAVKRRA